MDSKVITIEGEEVNFLRRSPGKFNYNPKKHDENGNEVPNTESPLYGKEYYRFSYNGKAFAVHTEDDFVRLYENDTLYAVRLTENSAGQLSLVAGVSAEKAARSAKTQAIIKKYREVAVEEVNEELLNSLAD